MTSTQKARRKSQQQYREKLHNLPETSAILSSSSDTGILHSQDFSIWTLHPKEPSTQGKKNGCD